MLMMFSAYSAIVICGKQIQYKGYTIFVSEINTVAAGIYMMNVHCGTMQLRRVTSGFCCLHYLGKCII